MLTAEDLLLRSTIKGHRTLNRDLGCILWVIFHRMGVPETSYKRVQILKGMAQGDYPTDEVLGDALQEVAKQYERLHPRDDERSIFVVARRLGFDEAIRTLKIVIRVNMTRVDGLARLLMLPIWAGLGFPSVQIGHRLCASMAVTRISDDVMDATELPWPVFEIEVPNGMFSTSVNEDRPDRFDIGFMLCGRVLAPFVNNASGITDIRDHIDVDAMPISYAVLATSVPCTLWSIRDSIAKLGTRLGHKAEGNLYGADPALTALTLPIDIVDGDDRTVAILIRVFANTALMLTAGHSRRLGKSHGAPIHSHDDLRGCPLPLHRVFTLTAPIRHDFRDAVGDYLRGGGSPPTVQGIVAGHWKMQPFGPQHSQRRLQFIEPYWRGPEDAPIAVRPTRLG